MSYTVPEWAMFVALLIGIAAGVASGIYLSRAALDSLKSDCAREHNVYACELIAMPIDPFHPEE